MSKARELAEVKPSRGGGSVSTNTAVGSGALAATATGVDNTALGNSALASTTSGARNTAIGKNAGTLITTGIANTAVGDYALRSNVSSHYNTAIGDYALEYVTGASNTGVGAGAGNLISSGSKNTVLGSFSGQSDDLDIRTSSNNIVLADGDNSARIAMTGAGVTRFFNGYKRTTTNNSKGGTILLLSRDVFFPANYFNAINGCTIVVNVVGSEGTAGGFTRTDILHVSYRFGYTVTSFAANQQDGVSITNFTYSFDSAGLKVTQNWGASGSNLGCQWSFLIAGSLFQG